MPRPCCLRHIDVAPGTVYFKPAGIPIRMLQEVILTLDELEALRLADLDGLYQERAAARMKVSRPTFARIVEQARRKVADALIHGKALRLEGGAVVIRGAPTAPKKYRPKQKGRPMILAIPVTEFRGLESPICGHFGSAPAFALVNADTLSVTVLGNRDQAHVHGACSPVKALAGAQPDVVIVGGIGAGALTGLRAAGIKVYRASGTTVATALQAFKAGDLAEFGAQDTCVGHGAGDGCHAH